MKTKPHSLKFAVSYTGICISFLLLISSIFFSHEVFSQTFCNYAGINIANETPRALISTFDGGYAIVGKSDSSFTNRILVYKYDAIGNLTWSRIIASTFSCEANSIVQTADSGLLVSGFMTTSSSVSSIEIFISKIKQDGTVLFTKRLGNSTAASDESSYASCLTADGGILLACQTNKNVSSAIDLMLVKVSANGTIQWVKDLIDPYFAEVPVAIKKDAHNNFLLSGYLIPAITSNPMFYDLFLVKLDSTGGIIWSKTLGGTKFDQANSLQILNNDAGYAICGRTESYVPATASTAAYLVVMDTAATIKWSRTFNLPSFQLLEFNGITVDANNDLVLCGQIQSYNNNDVPFLVKYNGSNGNIKWNRVYEDYSGYFANSNAIISTAGGYAIAGITNRYSFSNNIQLSTVDGLGSSCCVSDSLTAFVIDSGFTSANWTLFDTLTNVISDNGSFGTVQSGGAGVYNYCVSLGINETSATANWQIFPNPGTGIFEIKLNESTSSINEVLVYNSLGQKMELALKPNNGKQMMLDIRTLPKGIYFVQLKLANNTLLSQRLLKE